MAQPETSAITAYISSFPAEVQDRLQQIRETLKAAVPEAEEQFSYGIPGFKLHGVSIWYAASKKHIGLYPMYGLNELEQELAPYRGKNTKDTLHFMHSQPLPLSLITRIAVFKFKSNLHP